MDPKQSGKADHRHDRNKKGNRELMLAAKAQADVMRQKRVLDRAHEVFADAETIEQVLGYLAGGASVAWTKRPNGEFNSELASALVDEASARIRNLILEAGSSAVEALQAASVEGSTPDGAAGIDLGPENETAERMEREDHA